MDRKQFSSVLDEAVGKLESDVRILKNQQSTVAANLKTLEETRNKLSKSIFDLEAEFKAKKAEFADEIEKTNAIVADKLKKANEKDSLASVNLSELNNKIREADNLIKSNQNLQKNLNFQAADLKNKLESFKNIETLIKEILASL